MTSFWARYMASVPPGFENQPIVYMMTLFSLLMITLLALEWMWRTAWGAWEHPFNLKHPISVLRIILFCTATSIVLRVGPDVFRFAMWKDLSPAARLTSYQIDHYLDLVSFLPFSIAWLTGYLTMDMIHYQLDKRPLPMHLWPTSRQLRRPLKIGAAVFVIAAAITFFG